MTGLHPALADYARNRGAAAGRRFAAREPWSPGNAAPWRLDDPSLMIRRLAAAYFLAFAEVVAPSSSSSPIS